MLASSFSQLIFIDADVLFLQDPNKVYFEDSKLFKDFGTMFYFDRTIVRAHHVLLPFLSKTDSFCI
jgi:hypothetical protein